MGKFIWLGFRKTVENFPQGTGIIMGRNLRSHKPVKEDRTATHQNPVDNVFYEKLVLLERCWKILNKPLIPL